MTIESDQRSVKELRALAVDMPYRSEAKKAELLAWLEEYHPERLTEDGYSR